MPPAAGAGLQQQPGSHLPKQDAALGLFGSKAGSLLALQLGAGQSGRASAVRQLTSISIIRFDAAGGPDLRLAGIRHLIAAGRPCCRHRMAGQAGRQLKASGEKAIAVRMVAEGATGICKRHCGRVIRLLGQGVAESSAAGHHSGGQ